MSSTTKGLLALLRDLRAHPRRAAECRNAAKARRRDVCESPLPATRTYDLATEAGDTHWFTATGSPLLGERLSVLQAEMDLARFLRPD